MIWCDSPVSLFDLHIKLYENKKKKTVEKDFLGFISSDRIDDKTESEQSDKNSLWIFPFNLIHLQRLCVLFSLFSLFFFLFGFWYPYARMQQKKFNKIHKKKTKETRLVWITTRPQQQQRRKKNQRWQQTRWSEEKDENCIKKTL